MQIKYVGPKTLISSQGISFDKEKEDKFIYIDGILQLLEAIDYDYVGSKPHVYTAESRSLVGDNMLNRVKMYGSEVDDILEEAQKDVLAYLDAEIDRAKNSPFVDGEMLDSLLKNLSIMYDYRVQRFINKRIYYYLVKKFIERLRHHKLKYVSASAHKTYFHLFHTVKRGLMQQKNAINSELTYYVEQEALFIKLQVLGA